MTTRTRQPKRRNPDASKARILASAQECFATRGYAQSGIRDIAAMADVSSTLLLRYFGSKAGLFEAALAATTVMSEVLDIDRSDFGAHLARLLTDAGTDLKPPSILALATGNDEARQIATEVTARQVLEPLARWLGPPNGSARALEMMMLGMGFVLFTRQFPLLDGESSENSDVVAWFARSVQEIVDRK